MIADRDQTGGAESKEEAERAAEHGVRGDRSQGATFLHTQVRTATRLTPEHGRKNPDSDRTNHNINSSSRDGSPRPV